MSLSIGQRNATTFSRFFTAFDIRSGRTAEVKGSTEQTTFPEHRHIHFKGQQARDSDDGHIALIQIPDSIHNIVLLTTMCTLDFCFGWQRESAEAKPRPTMPPCAAVVVPRKVRAPTNK